MISLNTNLKKQKSKIFNQTNIDGWNWKKSMQNKKIIIKKIITKFNIKIKYLKKNKMIQNKTYNNIKKK
jgi:hypothetical protein